MIDIITRIGKAFGWRPMPYANGTAVHFSAGPGPKVVWLSDPSRFAAYAKAEMAKRGWLPFAEGTTAGYVIQFFDEYGEQANGNGQTTACHDYDPRDPIDEASASLRAIAEALSMAKAPRKRYAVEHVFGRGAIGADGRPVIRVVRGTMQQIREWTVNDDCFYPGYRERVTVAELRAMGCNPELAQDWGRMDQIPVETAIYKG